MTQIPFERRTPVHFPVPPYAYPLDQERLAVVLQVQGASAPEVLVHHGDRYTNDDEIAPMEPLGRTQGACYLRAIIPTRTRRVRYLFEIRYPDETIWLGESGPSCGREGIAPFQVPYIHREDVFAPPPWLKGLTAYQIFPERFCNGNPANDPEGVRPWDQDQDLASANGAQVFYGGDLEGIASKIDYLEQLGVGMVYLTPVFKAPSSHKYDVADYTHVAPCFGGDEALARLVRDLHDRGLKLILDVPLNHSGTEFFAFKDALAKGVESDYADWYRFFPAENARPNYETFAFVPQMPKLMTDVPAVRDYFLGIVSDWTRNFELDGWRLDVANEVDHDFWRAFRKRVRAENPQAFILGEIWHNALPWLNGDQFDSVTNYPWRDLVLAFFVHKRIKPSEFGDLVTALLMRYPDPVNQALINCLGSHDTPRIMTLAGGDERLVRLMAAFQFIFPGVPMIYYGDEIGLEGGPDPDCRRPMIWDEARQNRGLLEFYRTLVRFRRRYPWLNGGRYETVLADDDAEVYAVRRYDEATGEEVLAVFNLSLTEVDAGVPVGVSGTVAWLGLDGSRYLSGAGRLSLRLAPLEARILVPPGGVAYDYSVGAAANSAGPAAPKTVANTMALHSSTTTVDEVRAFLSNSHTLFTLSPRGEVLRWFWPHIDHEQHSETDLLGVEIDGQVLWQDDPAFRAEQSCVEDGLIVTTTLTASALQVRLTIHDALFRDRDVLVRRVTLENLGAPRRFRIIHYGHRVPNNSSVANTVYHDSVCDGLVTYRRNVWLGVNADRPLSAWCCAPTGAWPTPEQWGSAIAQGDVISLAAWDCGALSDSAATLNIALAAAPDQDSLRSLLTTWNTLRETLPAQLAAHRRRCLEPLQANFPGLDGAPPRVADLVRASVLVLHGLRDEVGGGLIAAPEFDPHFRQSGGYGYCWARDAAFIALALDEVGLHAMSRGLFSRWAPAAQASDGSFLHRHYADGLLAPSWGFLQIDETGSLLFAARAHARAVNEPAFVREFTPVAIRGAEFLLRSLDSADGLPAASIDLWEERTGKHLYSCAAVVAGLGAGAWWAEQAGLPNLQARCERAASDLARRTVSAFWDQERGRFLRTLDWQLGVAEYRLLARSEADVTRCLREGREVIALRRDPVIDASMLGLVFPYGVIPASDPRTEATLARIEAELTCPGVGGLFRYHGDGYAGGNPWIITTLWAGLVHCEAGRRAEAERCLDWATQHATELGLLPEQVDARTGAPKWVIPLAWSHAMYILLAARLYRRP